MAGSVAASSDQDSSEKERNRFDSRIGVRRSSINFSIDSKFSSIPELLISLDQSQNSGGNRRFSEDKKPEKVAPDPPCATADAAFPMESAAFGPLLSPEQYRGRVLTVDSLQRRRVKPGLLGDREVVTRRPRIAVVDGIHDLQQAVTGLLCRHNREDLEYVSDGDRKGKKHSGKAVKQDFLLSDPTYGHHLKAQALPVDDRITPQTLHTLLRHSRATVARILPPSLQPKEVVRYAASMKMAENNPVLLSERSLGDESLLSPRKHEKLAETSLNDKSTLRKSGKDLDLGNRRKENEKETTTKRSSSPRKTPVQGISTQRKKVGKPFSLSFSPDPRKLGKVTLPAKGRKTGRRYRKPMTVTGETPDEFIRRTACPPSSSRPTSVRGLEERASQALQLLPASPSSSSANAANVGFRPDAAQRQLSYEIKEMLKNDVRFSEAPNLALAHQATYYSTARDDSAPPGGIGIGFPSLPLEEKHPVEGCLTYPPVPVKYASNEEERRAKALQRLAPRGRKIRSSSEKSASTGNEFAAALGQEDVQGIEDGCFGYRVKEGSVLDYTFRIGSAGEDSSIVSQLVKELIETRREAEAEWERKKKRRGMPSAEDAKQRLGYSSAGNDEKQARGDKKTVFSIMESVLNVSKEFEFFQQSRSKSKWRDSSTLSIKRQDATARLVGFRYTRIPEEFWLSITDKSLTACTRFLQKKLTAKNSKNGAADKRSSSKNPDPADPRTTESEKGDKESVTCESLDNCSHLCNRSRSKDAGSDVTIVFPGAKPVERSQIYLLADILDLMLNQIENCQVLLDADVAKQILPTSGSYQRDGERKWEYNGRASPASVANGEGNGKDVCTEEIAVPPSEGVNPLLIPEIQQRSTAVHLQYANVAEKVVNTFDIGISEIVRQVGAHCIERGALLDTLRQSLVDVTKSSLNLLFHAKEVAFQEAAKRQDISERMKQTERRMLEQALRIQELEMDNAALYEWNNTLQLKASRMDTFLQRLEEKKKRFEFHTEDEHAFLLMELEKDMMSSASKAAETANMEKNMHPTPPLQGSGQAPTAAEARRRLLDTQSAMQTLYAESAELLSALHSCTNTANKACSPLYDNVSLGTLSPSANLPAAKWAAIARAVGDFEKEKGHRLRVFHVFSEWCNRFRKTQKKGNESAAEEGDFLIASSSDDSDRNSFLSESGVDSISDGSDGKGTLVQKSPQGGANASETRISASEKNDKKSSKLLLSSAGESSKTCEPQDSTVEGETSPPPELKFITYQDLQDMRVYDCTPEEVNAMFARSFDFKGFLHSAWEPSDTHFTLNISDVADMVHDVRVFIQELTLRMQALSDSAVMKKGIEPPINPPVHPEIPCSLCGRRETSGERRKHQETLQNIAREIQHQMEELTRKFQKAESEREDARTEARRLHQELNETLEREAAMRAEMEELIRARFTVGAGENNKEQRGRESVTSMLPSSPTSYSASTAPYATIQNNSPVSGDPSRPPVLYAVMNTGLQTSARVSRSNSLSGREKIKSPPPGGFKKKRSFTSEMLLSMSELLNNQHRRLSSGGSRILQNEATLIHEGSGEFANQSKPDILMRESTVLNITGTRELESGFPEKKSTSSSLHSGETVNSDSTLLERTKRHSD